MITNDSPHKNPKKKGTQEARFIAAPKRVNDETQSSPTIKVLLYYPSSHTFTKQSQLFIPPIYYFHRITRGLTYIPFTVTLFFRSALQAARHLESLTTFTSTKTSLRYMCCKEPLVRTLQNFPHRTQRSRRDISQFHARCIFLV